MRTLILNKFLHRNGGSETYIFKLGEALEQHGHEVQYFGMEHEGRCVGNRVNAYTSDMDFHGGSKLSKLTYPIKTIYSKEAIAYGLYQVFIVALINYKNSIFGESRKLKICYMISVLNVFLSVSRTPIIAFIVIQLLFWYRDSKKKFANYMFVALIGALVLLIASTSFGFRIPLIDDLLETINQVLSGNTASSGSTVGVGNRFDLWAWVYLSMGNKWIMGHGPTAEFAYKVYEWQTKTSIENQYLNILWHNGLVGLVLLILSYLSILIYSFKNRFHYILKSGETISFNMCVFLTMLTYYVVEFGVQESDMARIYTVFVWIMML